MITLNSHKEQRCIIHIAQSALHLSIFNEIRQKWVWAMCYITPSSILKAAMKLLEHHLKPTVSWSTHHFQRATTENREITGQEYIFKNMRVGKKKLKASRSWRNSSHAKPREGKHRYFFQSTKGRWGTGGDMTSVSHPESNPDAK